MTLTIWLLLGVIGVLAGLYTFLFVKYRMYKQGMELYLNRYEAEKAFTERWKGLYNDLQNKKMTGSKHQIILNDMDKIIELLKKGNY